MNKIVIQDLEFDSEACLSTCDRDIKGAFSAPQTPTFGDTFDFKGGFSADFGQDLSGKGGAAFGVAYGVGIGGKPVIDIGTGAGTSKG